MFPPSSPRQWRCGCRRKPRRAGSFCVAATALQTPCHRRKLRYALQGAIKGRIKAPLANGGRDKRSGEGRTMRLLTCLALAICLAAGAGCSQKSASNDKDNTLVLELKSGKVLIKLRPDLAPKHVERVKQLAG